MTDATRLRWSAILIVMLAWLCIYAAVRAVM
jgi:hypothetical protein